MIKFKQSPIGICIHHSLVDDSKRIDTEAYRNYHINVNGWDQIGYHCVAERVNGVLTLQKGRDEIYQGAHCPELNKTHLGLCFAGNFDNYAPDDDLLDFGVKVCQDLIKKYNMDINKAIDYHCNHSQKTCPGKLFPKEAFIMAVRGIQRP